VFILRRLGDRAGLIRDFGSTRPCNPSTEPCYDTWE
jgi:hypothetical protein